MKLTLSHKCVCLSVLYELLLKVMRFKKSRFLQNKTLHFLVVNLLKPNDIYIYMSYHTANLQTLHFIYLFNKYTYLIF